MILPDGDQPPKPLAYGIPYMRLDPEDLVIIEAMIRREVRAALAEIEDCPTPNIVTVQQKEAQ